MTDTPHDRYFPISAGVLFGVGLGGFFDGIVLHQVLQWHHMLSSWYPIDSIENLELNTFWDGIFHSSTYLFVVAGLFILWRAAQRRHLFWSSKLLIGAMLIGFGAFNPWWVSASIGVPMSVNMATRWWTQRMNCPT